MDNTTLGDAGEAFENARLAGMDLHEAMEVAMLTIKNRPPTCVPSWVDGRAKSWLDLGDSGVTVEQIKSRSRVPYIVRERDFIAHMLRTYNLSLSTIGAYLNRDHSTVLIAIRRHEARMK